MCLLCVSMLTSLDLPWDYIGTELIYVFIIHSLIHFLGSSSVPCPEGSDATPQHLPHNRTSILVAPFQTPPREASYCDLAFQSILRRKSSQGGPSWQQLPQLPFLLTLQDGHAHQRL